MTSSNDIDSGASPGWDIAETGLYYIGTAWTTSGDSVEIAIKGTAAAANSAPQFPSTTATRDVPENSAADTNVGAAVTADDADSDTLTYTLEGTDAASFDIDSGTGQIRTKASVTYDHETTPSYSVTVKADDGNGGTDTIAVTITVTDENEPPAAPDAPTVSATSGSTTSLDVSWTAPANEGKPPITSYDLRYRVGSSGSWTDGSQNVMGTTAAISALAAGTEYQVQVRASNDDGDSGWSAAGTGSTNVPANNAPQFPSTTATREVPENLASDQNVGAVLTATDADGDTLTYTLEGTDAASFDIDSGTGQIRTKAGVTYDHETTPSYSVTVTASDGTASATIDVTITVTDEDEPPAAPDAPTVSATAGSTTSLDVSWAEPANEGKPAITSYDLRYRVGDSGSWTDGPQDVTGTTAAISALAADTEYQVQVRATNAEGDSGWSAAGTGSTSAPGNNAPVFSDGTLTRTVPENSATNQNVGAVIPAARDADGDSLTYTMEGADAASFGFNASTRQITTITGVDYNYEATKNSYTVTVKASDGAASGTVAVTINVADVDEPPAAPGAPTVSATAGSTTSLDVSWTAPANTGKPAITSYDLRYRVGDSGSWTDGPQNVTGTTAAISAPAADTEYQVQVRASNAEGDSGWSAAGTGSTPTPAQPDTLVSNTIQISLETNNSKRDRAQAFTTGPNAGGYNLASVGLVFDDREGDDAAVSLCQVDNSNFPTSTCTALTAPGSVEAKLRVFTAPAATILTPSTTYAMVVKSPDGDFLQLPVISNDGEDLGGAAGWTIANNYSFYSTSGVWMNTSSGESLRITITGSAVGGTPPSPTLSVADAEGNEGDDMAFTVTLSEAAAADVTATWTASIESGDTAQAEDLGSTTGMVTVTASQTTATFTVPTTDDTTDEPDETFTLTLSSPSNATLAADPTATGTITDDDQGICNRTPRIRDRILVLLKYRHSYKGVCGDVNETHLAKLQSLDLGRNSSTESAFTMSLRSHDFEGLVNLKRLDLRETGLSSLPAGVFSGLAALETLELDKNRLSSLPAGVFSDLLNLKTLELHRNELNSLPYDEFEALPNLTKLLVDPEGRRGYQVAGGEGDVTLEVAAGGTTTYQVRLTHRPAYLGTANLPTLTVSSDTAGVTASPTTLQFTKENWFRRQTVTVSATTSAAGATATLTHTSVAVAYDRPIPKVTVRVLENAPGRTAEPLTATFEGVPARHDGETAFTFRIVFSETVTVTPKAMRTRVLTVDGGAVTGAARVDGESGVWTITVTPDTRETMSINLPPAADCEAYGAVCTSDGRALSNGKAHIVIGPGPETETQERSAPAARPTGLTAEISHDSVTLTWDADPKTTASPATRSCGATRPSAAKRERLRPSPPTPPRRRQPTPTLRQSSISNTCTASRPSTPVG